MGWFIFAIIFLVGGFVAYFCLKTQYTVGYVVRDGRRVETKEYPYKKLAMIILIAAIILGLLFAFLSCLAPVSTGHTGVVTTFGKVEDYTFDAGINFKAPWNSVVQLDNRVQKSVVQLSCFSSDIQEVEVQYALNYQISKSNAQDIYRTIGREYYSTVIMPNIAESVKVITARYTAEELIANRDTLAVNIENFLSAQLEKYNIEVVSTAIEDMDFTDEFTNAVEAKQVAYQNKLRAEIEQEQKNTEATKAAERAEIQANADASVARIQAQADMDVAKIASDSAEYQGKKEAAIAMQRLASINGWTVVQDEVTGINTLYKADGSLVTQEELKAGSDRLMHYYYIQQWNGTLPENYVSDDSIDSLILGTP